MSGYLSFLFSYIVPVLKQYGAKVCKQLVDAAFAFIKEVELHQPPLSNEEKKAWVIAKLQALDLDTGYAAPDFLIHWAFRIAFAKFHHEEHPAKMPPVETHSDYYFQVLASLPGDVKASDVIYESAARQYWITPHGIGGPAVPEGFVLQVAG